MRSKGDCGNEERTMRQGQHEELTLMKELGQRVFTATMHESDRCWDAEDRAMAIEDRVDAAAPINLRTWRTP